MELTFQKSADRWIAEFEASADFNLHIEGVVEGNVSLFQRGTASGAYAYVKGATPSPSYSRCYDYDFTSLVYPKFIKVSCATEPTYAEVVSSGEVTELKFQEKAVEITANGTHTIAPDAGFAALNAVQVKVNVPQGGGASGENTYEYIDVRGVDNIEQLGGFGITVRVDTGKGIQVLPVVGSGVSDVLAISFDTSIEYITPIGKMKCSDVLTQLGADTLPRITKEEFYTL